jgi:hypothetical protein
MATNPSFQTIRLSRGRHVSPHDGACVMELASMLAREPFTDRPRSVCPVIAMVLRAYNDGVDDDRRQELYAYASTAVGTRERRERETRLRRCEEFFGVSDRRRWLRRSRLHAIGAAALEYARNANANAHRDFLRLVDELVAGASAAPIAAPTDPARRDAAAH